MPDSYTCFIPVERRYEESLLLQGMRAVLAGASLPRLALCFLQHTTRQRICVQGEVEILPAQSSDFLWLCMHVKQAFFHCPKYIRTRVSGLHMSVDAHQLRSSGQEYDRLDEEVRAFLDRQVLCYLCTIDREGQCAVNHRGGAAGFLVTLEPDRLTPGGVVLLPDYSGNGAFEAIGNILETGKATLLVPGYAEQLAFSITGDAAVLEPGQLPRFLRERCRGAMRIVALTVCHVERQDGDWSEALAYERSRADVLDDVKELARNCQV
jgi:predicted pyridoxine 5'-phosphate oxidase superfamily flavin-nucleotide-binding protein